MRHIIVNAVFEGGGAKAIGLAGAVAAAEEAGVHFGRLAGTSAGAIVAALLAAGYTPAELHDLIFELDADTLTDPTFLGRIPLIGAPLSVLLLDGLYAGDRLEGWLSRHLAAKGVRTFADLGSADRPLRVIASDVSRGEMLVLPDDATDYGIEPGELSVARAVRMSASIPFFYRPVVLSGPSGKRSYILDGGLLSNFPVWLFSGRGGGRPVLGFRLREEGAGKPRAITGPLSLLVAIFSTMMEANDRRVVEHALGLDPIDIPVGDVSTTSFSLTPQQKEALFQAGKQAAADFFRTWDYNDPPQQQRRVIDAKRA